MTVLEGKILPPAVNGAARDHDDPPVFLLQAASTWAPWLPDGVYQRVPIGAAAQVLTAGADGSVGWANNPAGFANPMTAAGDLIQGGAGGTPTRFAIGSNGQVLTVQAGALAWVANSTVGFVNPMTASQDLIVGGTAGAAGRLGVGANGQVLGVTAGAVGWVNNPAGFANPMTTLGDLISAAAGGTAQRLAVGANGQVLSVVGGVPAWANSPAGFANPMTTPGDMIVGGLAGAATRLPAGANGLVLTLVQGSPAWAAGASGASAVVFPSGDATGVTDQANITNAFPASGGQVLLAAGSFYVKPASGLIALNIPAQTTAGTAGGSPVSMRGLGAATVIFPVGAGVTGLYHHRTSGYGGQFGNPAQRIIGTFQDFVVDGTFATGASVGFDIGDGWGAFVSNVAVQNFTGTGAIGWWLINRVFWSEKHTFIGCHSQNNQQAVILDVVSTNENNSHEYCYYDFSLFVNANQNGVIYQNGAWQAGGGELRIRGNFGSSASALTGTPAVLTVQGTTTGGKPSHLQHLRLDIGVEINQGFAFAPATIVFGSSVNYITDCNGMLDFQNPQGFSPAVLNGGAFRFSDPIYGDTVLGAANKFKKFTAALPANVSGIVSTTGVMAGFGQDATSPTTLVVPDSSSGMVAIVMTGTARTNTAIVVFNLALAYGTTTPPVFGAAPAGTQYGFTKNLQADAITGEGEDWTFAAVVQVTPGSTLWADLVCSTSAAADALVVNNISCTMVPLQ